MENKNRPIPSSRTQRYAGLHPLHSQSPPISELNNDQQCNQEQQQESTLSVQMEENLTFASGTSDSDTSSDVLSSEEQTTTDEEDEILFESPSLDERNKTPMVLVSELARYNNIEDMYTFIGTTGPAHANRVRAALKLGNEEYITEGPTFTKSSQCNAAVAMAQTKYDHPPVKTFVQNRGTDSTTPIEELNALTMKKGIIAVYKLNLQQHQQQNDNDRGSESTNIHQQDQRYYQPRTSEPYNTGSKKKMFEVTLTLALKNNKFTGVGLSHQAARHNAAAQALQVLQEMFTADESSDPGPKFPISLACKLAWKMNLPILFKALGERGPSHMRTFVTLCEAGKLNTIGEGRSKEISKKRAARKMIEELKKLPPLTSKKSAVPSYNNKTEKEKTVNVNRDVSKSNSGDVFSSALKCIKGQQALKQREPVYNAMEQKPAKEQESDIEVPAGENGDLLKTMKCNNWGSTSSQAPFELGLAAKPSTLKGFKLHSQTHQNNSSNVKSVELYSSSSGEEANVDTPKSIKQCTGNSVYLPKGFRSTEKLACIARLLKFKIQFTYDKRDDKYITTILLSKDPPEIFEGVGNNFEASQDAASRKALIKMNMD